MRSLISSAIHYLDKESDPEKPEDAGHSITCDDRNRMPLMKGGEPVQKPGILVVGCGGTGHSVINRLFHTGFSGPQTMVIDHDLLTFDHCHASIPFLLKSSYFRHDDLCVLEGHPDIVATAMENACPDLDKKVGDPDLCIIIAGMSGNAGTGSAPVIARLAKARGSTVMALVTLPSRLEKSRYSRAGKGLEALLQAADSVYVLDLNCLLKMTPENLPFRYVYSTADQLLADIVRNLYECVCTPSMVNLEFADLIHITGRGGYGTILVGETLEPNFVEGVSRDCRNNWMGDIPHSAMTGCIVFIEGYYCGLFYSEEIAAGICLGMDPRADVIRGVHEDHTMPEGEMRAYALVSTGKKDTRGRSRKNAGF